MAPCLAAPATSGTVGSVSHAGASWIEAWRRDEWRSIWSAIRESAGENCWQAQPFALRLWHHVSPVSAQPAAPSQPSSSPAQAAAPVRRRASRERLEECLSRIGDPGRRGRAHLPHRVHARRPQCRRRRRCPCRRRTFARSVGRQHRLHQGSVRCGRRADPRRLQGPGGCASCGRRCRDRAPAACRRRRDRRQDQHGGVRLYRSWPQPPLWVATQPRGSRAGARRLIVRRGGRVRGRHVRDRHRVRHRGLGACSGGLVRGRRLQAIKTTRADNGGIPALLYARFDRPPGEERRRSAPMPMR